MSKHKGPTKRRPWQPLERAVRIVPATTRAYAESIGYDIDAEDEVWRNDKYIVHVVRTDEGWPFRLSIRRVDRGAARDWRDFQRIKDQLCGPDAEAIELYPARDRLVDSANQYWLWCLPPGARFPVGFDERMVSEDTSDLPTAKQRPFDAHDASDGFASEPTA